LLTFNVIRRAVGWRYQHWSSSRCGLTLSTAPRIQPDAQRSL